jgi:hypothetical protein
MVPPPTVPPAMPPMVTMAAMVAATIVPFVSAVLGILGTNFVQVRRRDVGRFI